MENEKILSPHYLEAYNYFYSVIDNKLYFKNKAIYYTEAQVLENKPDRKHNEFPITFVKVKNDGKTMARYIVYDGRSFEVYEGDIEYKKTRVFVLSGISDDDRQSLEYVVHIGYAGLYYNLVGMDSITYGFKTHVIDWGYEDDWKVSLYDEPDEERSMCMDFMAVLSKNGLGEMTKEGMDDLTAKCVKQGLMNERPLPQVYLKDILCDELFSKPNEDLPF